MLRPPRRGARQGGVEARGRGIRLQHLTPIPRGESLREISERLLSELGATAETRRNEAGQTVRERFDEELRLMRPLPDRLFDARKAVLVSIRSTSRVRVEGAWYSVPEEWARLDATALVGVETVTIICRGQSVEWPRLPAGSKAIDYRHYLRELSRKPQAVRQVASELTAQLGEPFPSFWSRLEETYGPREGARVLAKALGAVRDHGDEPVREAIVSMLESGRISFIFLPGHEASEEGSEVKVPEALASYEIEAAQAADYDRLLAGVGS